MGGGPPPRSGQHAGPVLSLEVWGATDQGREREGNEDYVYPHTPADTFSWQPNAERLAQKGRLLVVADGIGGAQAGREASSTTTKIVVERYYELSGPDPGHNLRVAIEEANSSLYQQISARRSLQGAGTTITAAAIKDGMLHVANVGDSRTYLIRNGQITQLTRDHTLTQQKLDRGLIRPEQVGMDPDRSVLTRSIGAGPSVQVDVFPRQQLAPGDVVLLCSDGLTDMLDDGEIARIAGKGSPKRAARELIKEANKRGGFDNISVVIAKVGGPKGAAGGGLLSGVRAMSGRQKAILVLGALLVGVALCAMAYLGWKMYERSRSDPTATPVPTATAEIAPTATTAPTTAPTQATPTEPPPTDTVPAGAPTSTPRPTFTPTNTPRPPTNTPIPTNTPVPPTSTPETGGNGEEDSDDNGNGNGEEPEPTSTPRR